MPTYTAEQARRIVAGLVSNKRPGCRPMTEAQFLKQYDPEADQVNKQQQTMERIAETLERLAEGRRQPAPQQRPSPARAPRQPRTVDL